MVGPLRWLEGDPWPTSEWTYSAPSFHRCLGGPLRFVEILDEHEFPALGYRTTGRDPPQIPDFLGRTRGGEWVLYESKSDDHLDVAVGQLSDGLEEFMRIGHPIDKLGIAVNTVQGNESYIVTKAGSLLSHVGLMPGTVIRLGANSDMPIMVEVRRPRF